MVNAIQAAYNQAETVEAYVQKPLAQILDDIVGVLQRFIVLPGYDKEKIPHGFIALALWVAHTHTFQFVDTTPYLQVWSATMRAGKTTVLEFLNELVAHGWLFSDVTLAALTRKIDRDSPTMLYDEGDAANKELSQALGGIFNAGYKRGSPRTIVTGPTHEPTDLNVYCPKAFAGIGSASLRETLRDRAIPIELRRRKPSERVERNRVRRRALACGPIKAQLEGWAASKGLDEVLSIEVPDIPEELDDRQQDVWEPLLAIADAAGGDWPQLARKAAIVINANRELTISYAETLLRDIRVVFMTKTQEKAMFTVTLLSHLNSIEGSPWGSIMWGNSMNATSLAKRLRDFNIHPKDVRIGEANFKGYQYEDFREVFERNLPAWEEPVTRVTRVTRVTPEAKQSDAPPAHVTDVTAKEGKEARQSGVLMLMDWEAVQEEKTHVE